MAGVGGWEGFGDEAVTVEELEEAGGGEALSVEGEEGFVPRERVGGVAEIGELGGGVEAAEGGEGAETVLDPGGGIDEVGDAGGGFALPVAELAGKTDFGAAVEPGGGVDVDVGGVAETGANFAEGVDKGYIFKRFDGRETAGAAVNGGGAGE